MKKLTCIYWIRDEARYLPEYLEFHLLQGVDHFILYQDGDTDRTPEVLKPYIDQGLVEYRTIPPEVLERKNFWVMAHCIDEQKGKSEWIHFHAIDERVFNPQGRSLVECLAPYERPDISGVAVNWIQIHSGGQIEDSPGLIIERFTQGQEHDPMRHVKTMIRPHLCLSAPISNPHNFTPQPGAQVVNEKYEPTPSAYNGGQYTFDTFCNFHYACMSEEEYETKVNKGVLDLVGGAQRRRPDVESSWAYYHGHGDVYYNQLLPWVEPVRKAIAQRYEGQEHLLEYVNH